jgi:plastocyanin
MTWLWRIVFSVVLAQAGLAAEVSGSVRLSHSRVAAVRNGRDYSGVVVWLEPVGAAPVAREKAHLTMEQKGKRFIPHVLAAPVGATVRFPNLDPIFHSAFSSFSGQIFDFGLYPPGTSRDVTFTRPGVVRIFCNIHPAMSAVIVVLKTPWYAVSAADGRFAIHDVPAGEYRLHAFHERATVANLTALETRVEVTERDAVLPPLDISETGYLEVPHKNEYGQDYPPTSENGAYPAGRK